MSKPITVAPLTGILDVRSSPDLMPKGSLRMRQNLQTVDENKLRRGCGWTKLLTRSQYNNQDFHDQLLTFDGTTREPITLLCESESSRGIRTLWLATQSRIARLNEVPGNWKVIGAGLGGGAGTDCSGPRFKAAVQGDYMLFTNNFDRPKVHRLEQPPFDSTLLADIDDLETIGLSKAGLVWAWRNVVFLADVEMDGERFGYRVVWSDYNNPTSFDPSKAETIAGFKDLEFGERILAGGPTSSNTYLLYTTKRIWEISIVGGEQVFGWRVAYDGTETDCTGILQYENTLVDIGGDHLYMAKDRLYLFNAFRTAPEPIEWLHRSDLLLYSEIDAEACSAHIGFFHDGEAFFSIKRLSDTGCPGVTLRVETQYKVADLIDHGFTAATNFRSQELPTIRDFIIDKRICTAAGLDAEGYGWENEGLPAPAQVPTAAFEPQTFYTATTQEIETGLDTEDWEQPEADADSLCALLGELRLDDMCRGCESPSRLVLASAQDLCLKEYGETFYRERCANPTAVGTTGSLGYTSSAGSYILDPYTSLLRFAPMFVDRSLVTIERLQLTGIPAAQGTPSLVGLRVGSSGQTADPNDDRCLIVWHEHTDKQLKCLTNRTSVQHLQKGSVPSQVLEWRFWRMARNLFLELRIEGTGGDCVLSGIQVDGSSSPVRNY